MKTQNIEDWTFEELVDFCSGHVLQELLRGRFREGMFTTVELAARWRRMQDEQEAKLKKKH